jgi:uncharacterized membrane protein
MRIRDDASTSNGIGRLPSAGTTPAGRQPGSAARPHLAAPDGCAGMTSIRVIAFVDRLRSSLWFIPGTMVIGAGLLALALVSLDRLVDQSVASNLGGILFAGGPDSARLVLSTIAAAMLTFTGLVFTVTMLVLQLASAQLSPRVMRTFLRDRLNQGVLGLFIATFLYALLLLRDVRSPLDGPTFVPAIAVTVAYGLVLASVGLFVVYIHHMAQAIRAATVLRSVGDETREAIRRLYPEGVGDEPAVAVPSMPERPPDGVATLERSPGVITSVDEDALLRLAAEHGISIELTHMVGDFVATGAPLLRVWRGSNGPADRDGEAPLPLDELAKAIQTGIERTMTQDASFGFRQIVDIAERALSPGINDPTTAVQALDELHDLLRRLARRGIPSPVRRADDGSTLLLLPRPDWDDYVSLALDEIRLFGAGSIQVARRLRYLLLDLQEVAPGSRQAPIVRQLQLLDAALASRYEFAADRRAAAEPSPSGQGPEEAPVPAPESLEDEAGAGPTTA